MARYAEEALHFGATLDENGKVSSLDLEIE
jgi:hypothetical protein